MATVHIRFGAVHTLGSATVYGAVRVAEVKTSSASSQATTAVGLQNEIATITASGGAVYVTKGSAPTAAGTTGDMVPDGGKLDIVLNAGDKIAIIDI